MLLNLYCYMIFIPMIFISSIMILISNSWFSQWMIMEINLISFLSMIVFEKKMNSISMNYFLVQSFNSYMFIMMMMNLNFLNLNISSMMLFVVNLVLLTKMGLPPFYLWYIKIMKFLSWMNCLLLLTIQKLIPLMILNNLSMFNNLLVLKFNMMNMVFMSLICAMLGLQSLNLKILMAYSSIIQMSWLIMLIYLSEVMFLNYMLIYFFISLTLVLIFNKFNFFYVNNLMMFKFINYWMYLFYMFILMSMASIPPYFGFMMKWISIQTMNYSYSFIFILLMIMNSLISMYFYLRLMFISFLNYSSSNKINFLLFKNNINNNKLIYLIWLMLILLLSYEII